MNEKELVEKAKAGDQDSFNLLLRGVLGRAKLILCGKLRMQPHDADDSLQKSSLKAWNKLSTFKGESSFFTWFYRIMYHDALDLLKSKQNKEVYFDFSSQNEEDVNSYDIVTIQLMRKFIEEQSQEQIEKRERCSLYQELINSSMNSLSPNHKNILTLHLYDGLSYKDIAEKLQIPLGTVMSRICYAKRDAQTFIKHQIKQQNLPIFI